MRLLHVYTRHRKNCPDSHRGIGWQKCGCPKWISGTLNGKFIRKSSGFSDWMAADAEAINLERIGYHFHDQKLSLAIEAWKNSLSIAPGTKRKYFRLMRQIEEWAGTAEVVTVTDLTLDALDKFYQVHKPGPRTKGREIQTIRSFDSFCMERRWRTDSPAKKVKPPKGLKPNEVEIFSQDEIVRMVAACDQITIKNKVEQVYARRRARAMILLLREVAPRLGDAYRMRRDCLQNGVLTYYTQKTAHPIVATLSHELIAALEALPEPMGDLSMGTYFFWNGYVPTDQTTGKACEDDGVRFCVNRAGRMIAPIFRLAKVKNGHAHKFRHTIATEMLAEGAAMPDVALTLGNTVAVCETVYAKHDVRRRMRADDFRRRALGSCTPTVREDSEELPEPLVIDYKPLAVLESGAGGGICSLAEKKPN